MSDNEVFEAQGRAHANLKKAKSRAATAEAILSGYCRELVALSRLIEDFLADPVKTSNGIHLSDHVKSEARQVRPEEIFRMVDEFKAETALVAEIQAQVDRF